MKTAKVNGVEISEESVRFELDRLMVFYKSHGMTADEIRGALDVLREKALEQAIGAKLLVDRANELDIPVSAADIDGEMKKLSAQIGGPEALEKAMAEKGLSVDGLRAHLERAVRVNKLVEQSCTGVAEPEEGEVKAFYEAHRAQYAGAALSDVHGQIKDLMRHEARGKAVEAFVGELRARAKIEYADDCGHDCCCHHHA